jgi:hypothetical protein
MPAQPVCQHPAAKTSTSPSTPLHSPVNITHPPHPPPPTTPLPPLSPWHRSSRRPTVGGSSTCSPTPPSPPSSPPPQRHQHQPHQHQHQQQQQHQHQHRPPQPRPPYPPPTASRRRGRPSSPPSARVVRCWCDRHRIRLAARPWVRALTPPPHPTTNSVKVLVQAPLIISERRPIV